MKRPFACRFYALDITFVAMDDLFYNAGSGMLFLRINNVYYQRQLVKGWRQITEEQVIDLEKWSKLYDRQREAYVPALKQAGLID
ncbi:hypothetical protein [Spirosoma sp.]|uniref:hypothetical protein n=1 Tax=Spirosoma sp. TaxID=1899569 RepID=UPI003B3B1CE0